MKFEEYQYVRPNVKNIKKEFERLFEKLDNAESFEKFNQYILKINKLRAEIDSMYSLVDIRFKMNTKDEFYKKEKEILDKISPIIQNLENNFFRIIAESKFKDDFSKEYGNNILQRIDLLVKTISPKIVKLLEKENKLTSKYSRLIGSAEIIFDGKRLNLSGIKEYFESEDREIRKKANEAYWDFFKGNKNKFDNLYDQLVKVRQKIAIALGYKNFVQLAYDRLGRNDWDIKKVKELRKICLKQFMEIQKIVIREQEKNLGFKLKYYDEAMFFKKKIKLRYDYRKTIKNVKIMFSEMGDETKEFFSSMVENNLLDLIPRMGKAGGGFCGYIKNKKSPFIFMSFNNTPDSLVTLIHESGHALNTYKNISKTFMDYIFVGYEVAEIHSMSMEFFSWPWLRKHLEEANRFKTYHLAKSISFIPYGLLVDEFQHWVYENDTTTEGRKSKWRELEKKYLPYKDYENNEFLKKGALWYRQLHIFESPFYYIDYVIAQFCAFQFLLKSNVDFKRAWKDYINIINCTLNKSLLEILPFGNIENPFEKGTIKKIAQDITTLFEDLARKS